MQPVETWRPVVGYENKYEVSSFGAVRSLDFNKTGATRLMSLQEDRYGYARVGLSGIGKQKYCLVHRLVAQAFIRNPDNLSAVNHIDGDKGNNSAVNLEWCTNDQNMAHSSRMGLHRHGEAHPRAVLNECRVLEVLRRRNNGESTSSIARSLGVGRSTVGSILSGKNWRRFTTNVEPGLTL